MDTVGTEHLILSKAGNTLATMKPIVICETLYNEIEVELEIIMKSYGYEFYNHKPAGLIKTNSIIREVDDGVRNCFFVHPSKLHLVQEYIPS